MHAPVFSLFVCHYGRSLVPADSPAFLGHIDLCMWELGLASPARPTEHGTVPLGDGGAPDGFNRDATRAEAWLAEQLRPFGGRADHAAAFAMRLTAARFGLIHGPADPSVAQVLDASLWVSKGRKAWWRFW
ncbi:hypothetical protein R5W24_000409 [Gemmata sp. JC717]|uniref:hypothetical protein n=1 Tax=Gemmata algarum TaxID=2975278 RepID=UPI0021BB102A|nr:hypothetical protein [Gemmata algarum]MDY3551334.1 hypothetical protein [Gemmata algarum]